MNHCKLGYKNLGALTLTHHWSREKKTHMKISTLFFPTRSRRDIRENPKHQLFDAKFVQKLSFSIKIKFVGDSAEETRRQGEDRCKSRGPICHPSRDTSKYYQNSIPYINHEISKKMAFLRCPTQFWEFYTEVSTPYLNSTFKGIECRPHCFLFFFTIVLVDVVFFLLLFDWSYFEKKEKKTP